MAQSQTAYTSNKPEFLPETPRIKHSLVSCLKAKPYLCIGIGLGLFLLVGIVLGITFQKLAATHNPQTSSQNQSFAFVGQVKYLNGTAWKIISERKVELKESDQVSEGEEIITDPDTRLVLSFEDGSTVSIDENTKIKLTLLSPETMILTNNQGQIFARVSKDKNHSFIVHAKNYAVTALGTAFSVENIDEVKIGVYESQVKVEADGQLKTEITANQKWQEKEDKLTTITSTELIQDQFIAWNLAEEEPSLLATPTPESTQTPSPTELPSPTSAQSESSPTPKPASQNSSLILSGKAYALGVILEWQTSNLNSSNGFKIIKSLDPNPTFPEDHYVYLNRNDKRFDWKIADGNTWHFRVCQYLESGKCGIYSNDVSVATYKSESATPVTESNTSDSLGEIKIIGLTIEKTSEHSARVKWSPEGYSDLGFKVVWSKNSSPTYPNRDGDHYHYYSDPGKREDEIHDLESGTHYFRVCEYLGGKCGVYSNEVNLSL